MKEKICEFCGTINDAHHSAECVDRWDTSHYVAIESKAVMVSAEKVERLEQQNSDMLAMLKRVKVKIAADGIHVDNCVFFKEISELIKKAEGGE